MRLDRRGFTLVEVLVATGIIALMVLALATFQGDYFKKFSSLSSDTKLLSSLQSIEEDIFKDQRFIIAQSDIPSLQGDQITDDALAASFNPPTKVSVRCYSKQGARVDEGPDCHHRVLFYKMSIRDRRFSADSAYARVPMSRLNLKIEFPQDEEARPVYISKILTDVLPF